MTSRKDRFYSSLQDADNGVIHFLLSVVSTN